MAHHSKTIRPSDLDPSVALKACVGDPLGLESRDHVDDWLEVLKYHFPLWAFQAWAFAKLQDSTLHTNYPLQPMIQSILRDDGVELEGQKPLKPLAFAVDRRRDALAFDGRYDGPTIEIRRHSLYDTYEQPPLGEGKLSPFHRVYLLPERVDFDSENPATYGYPFWEIGSEVVRLLDARESARGEKEEQEAKRELDEFLTNVAGRLPKKQTAVTAWLHILQPLVDQGVKLLETGWDAFLLDPSQENKEIFTAHEVTDPDMQRLWAARLALPVLSRREILFLKAQSEGKRAWTSQKGGSYPTPEQLAIWIIARRLRMEPQTLAYYTLSKQTASKHFDRPNPIDAIGE